MKSKPISISQAINFAWFTFQNHYGLFTVGLLTIFCAWIILEVVVIAGQRFGVLVWALAHLALLILFVGIQVGLIKISLALYDGEEPTYSHIFAHLALGPRFLAGQLLYLLIVLVGFVFMIIPGIYFGMHYIWVGFYLVRDETTLIRSFQQSAALGAGTKVYLFTIFAILLLINLIGACILGLGLLITIPLSILMLTAIYRQLSALVS